MKCFFRVALVVLALSVESARAEIITVFRPITADSGDPESPFVEYIPAGYSSWAMEVTTRGDARWLASVMQLQLDTGSIYYHPFGQPDRTSPNAQFFGLAGAESLRFSSYVAAPTISTEPFGQRRTPGVVPDSPAVLIKRWDVQHFDTGWFESDPGDPNSVPGTHVIGIFTISSDARGEFSLGASWDHDSAGTGGIDYSTWIVQDGAFDFTGEPPLPPPPLPITDQPFFISGTGFEDAQVGMVQHKRSTGMEFGFTRTVEGDAVVSVIGGNQFVPAFTNGEQGYSVGGRGAVELNFDVVSLQGAKDVELTLDVWVADRNFDPEDSLLIRVDVIGGGGGELSDTLTLLDVTGADINAGELTKGEWNSLQLDIADEWWQAALQIVSNTNEAGADVVFIFDSITFAGEVMPIPEPSSLVLVLAGALGLVGRLGRRRARGRQSVSIKAASAGRGVSR